MSKQLESEYRTGLVFKLWKQIWRLNCLMLKCHLNSSVVTLLWSHMVNTLFTYFAGKRSIFTHFPLPGNINPLSFALPCSDLYWQDTNDRCAKRIWGLGSGRPKIYTMLFPIKVNSNTIEPCTNLLFHLDLLHVYIKYVLKIYLL